MGQVAQATTWAPVYSFTQRTEGGAITCRSVPYGVHDGPAGLGETFVYSKGKLLYSIDKYFSTSFFTHGNGRYLVSIDFHVSYPNHVTHIIDGSGIVIKEKENEPDARVIHIYDQGVLHHSIAFGDLRVDRSKVLTNTQGGWFAWNYTAPEQDASALLQKMAKHPAFVEGDRLCLIAADGQLIQIHIPSGDFVGRSTAAETLDKRLDWSPSTFKRKYERVKYPDKFFLPPLKDGNSLGNAVAELLGMVASDEYDEVDLNIYLHTLLINDQGRCELAYITVTPKQGMDTATGALEELLVAWMKEQSFDTRSMPRRFPKFKYSDFIRLDRSP
jgi:hypothetical protein